MKKKLLTVALTATLAVGSALAVPARRDVVHRVVQPDGTVLELTKIGDERRHCFLTTDHLPVMVDASGRYCFATIAADGTAVAADVPAANPADRNAAQRAFVASINPEQVLTALSKTPAQARRANQSTGIGLFASRFPHLGSPHAIVILVQYTDKKFTVTDPQQYYHDFLNQEGFSQHKGTGSVRDYFTQSSNGAFTPVFDVYGPVQLSNNMAYYGGNDAWGNDKAPEKMVTEACQKLDATVNFADYDTDNDGYVDNIYVIYAGQGEASYGGPNTVWPHSWDLKSATGSCPVYDGVKINDYGCGNEWDDVTPSGIGTYVHEFGHVMGLPDLYTTDYNSQAVNKTPGKWSVMDYGSYNNDGRTPPSYSIYERNAFGWIDPIVISQATSLSLPNIHDNNTGAVILTDSKDEFFLFENRQQVGWDKYLPGHGMIVWHIDYVKSVWDKNAPNNTASHQYVDIEEAGGTANNEDDATMATYPFPGTRRVTSFTSTTKPALTTWAGKAIALPITDITEQGGVISFDVDGGIVNLTAPEITVGDVTGIGFTVSWNAVEKATSYGLNVCTKADDGTPTTIAAATTAETSYTFDRLDPQTTYYVTVTARRGNIASDPSAEATVTTADASFEMLVPKILPSTIHDNNSFTAEWLPVEGAVDYIINVIGESEVAGGSEFMSFGSGNSLKLNTGWTSNSSEYYGTSSTGYFCTAAPALKFKAQGQYLLSPVYDNRITYLKFWMRGAGTSVQNFIEVLGMTPPASGTPSDDDWAVLATYDSINNTKDGMYCELNASQIPTAVRQVKVVFNKIENGNLALDDLTLNFGGSQSAPLENYTDRSLGNITSHVVTAAEGNTHCVFTITAVNAAGTKSRTSDAVRVELKNLNFNFGTSVSNVAVKAARGTIAVAAPAGTAVAVTDILGHRIAASTGSADFCVAPGFYIVTVGQQAFKVQVR